MKVESRKSNTRNIVKKIEKNKRMEEESKKINGNKMKTRKIGKMEGKR